MNSKNDFEEIYIQYSDKIYRFLYVHLQDAYLSEDLVSEVFIKAWKNWKNFKPDFIQAWLYKIANNTLIDFYRSKKEKKKVSIEDYAESEELSYDREFIEEIHKNEEIKKLNKAIESLPKKLKDVAILRFIENLSAKEAGKILKISEVNVRVLQHRALSKLKEIIKNEK